MEAKEALARIGSYIDREELAELALRLGEIRGPGGHEEEVGEAVYQWLCEQGIPAERQYVAGERFNVIARLPGSGGGKNLAFNSHLDTVPYFDGEPQADQESRLPYRTWADGDRLYGLGVMNCRGPMATWLIALKALKESGVRLSGDVIGHAVVGETGPCPIDEYQGPRFLGNGVGTEMAARYGPAIDYALVAETTDFGVTRAECGLLHLKIQVRGVQGYSPRMPNPVDPLENPNAIVKAALLIQKVTEFAQEYEKKNTLEFEDGTIIPKICIGSIRGGYPPVPTETAKSCTAHVACWILPEKGPGELIRELRARLREAGLEVELEQYMFKRGYIGRGVEPLIDSIRTSYREIFNADLPRVRPEVTSMWRDINIYNEMGIPSVTFGPKRHVDPEITGKDLSVKYLLKDEMASAAEIYAKTAIRICG